MIMHEADNSNSMVNELSHHALNIRKNIIKMLSMAGSGHTAGSLDVVEILTVLYGALINY